MLRMHGRRSYYSILQQLQYTMALYSLQGSSFAAGYAARVPSRRRLRESAAHRRRLITVSGVAAPVAALDAEVVIVVEVLASEPGAFASLLNASAAASSAANSVDATAISATLAAAVPTSTFAVEAPQVLTLLTWVSSSCVLPLVLSLYLLRTCPCVGTLLTRTPSYDTFGR